ncbi:hypothetical protein V5O48_016782 [Marasmius crinis-equi]|uniref:RlpA-like protein double-psi beta-barrel domain-containing protein n=1 Tax=Marasmius crinis-equi TaxID=585013 RepID=A0ABR3EQS6_9AGAR
MVASLPLIALAVSTLSLVSAAGPIQTGGFATWFTQGGIAGACGQVHSDSDFIAAIDQARYGDLGAVSSLCGKQVSITNNNNGNSVTVTIVDACPTCSNSNSFDLSLGAFEAIGDLSDGRLPILDALIVTLNRSFVELRLELSPNDLSHVSSQTGV